MELARVLQAIKRADAAGDTEAAKKLGAVARQMMNPESAIPVDYTTGELLSRSVKRGAKRLGSTFGDILPAMGASALGFDEYAKRQMEEAAQTEREIAQTAAPQYKSLSDVKGIRDYIPFALETVAEQVPNIATSLVPGVGAGALAARAGLGAVGKAAAVNAGTFLGAYSQNAPEVFQNIYQETGQLAPGASAIFGAGAAALDSILPASLARRLSGPVKAGIVEKVLEKSGMDKGLLRSVTANIVKGVPTEGLTEGSQEAISIAAEKFVADNPQIFESKEWNRIMESAVRGAVAGGAFGGLGGGIEAAQNAAQRRAEYADALERRGDRLAAAEVRRQSAEIEAAQAQQAQMQLPGFEAGPATGLFTPPTAEPERKELKGKQLEMFGEAGELTPGMEKAATKDEKSAANRARLEEQRRAAALKEDQAALKKAIAELTQTPADLLALAKQPSPLAQTIGQARGELDALAAKRAPKPVPAPAVAPVAAPVTPSETPVTATETTTNVPSVQPETTLVEEPKVRSAPSLEAITKIDDPKAFGKLFGIGPTARILRPDGPLAGKDLTDPAQAAEVKQILEAYASGKPAVGAAEKIDAFLKRPEFQGAADVARPVEQPVGAGAVVPSEPTAESAAAAQGAEPSGVVPSGEVVGDLTGGEGQQPGALEATSEEVIGVPAETAAPAAMEEPLAAAPAEVIEPAPAELGKKAKTDLAKAEAGTEKAVRQQGTLAKLIDRRVDGLLKEQVHRIAKDMGVDMPEVESQIGTDVHNALRLPPLINEFFRLRDVARQQGNDPAQQRKNQLEMDAVREAISRSGVSPDEVLAQFQNVSADRRQAILDQIGKQALDEFILDTEARIKSQADEIAARRDEDKPAPKKLEGSALRKAQAEVARRKLSNAVSFVYNNVLTTDAAKAAFKKEVDKGDALNAIEKVSKTLSAANKEILRNELNFIYGKPLFLPAYQGPTFNKADIDLANAGDFNGLLRSMLNQIKDPAIKQVLRKLRSLNLNVKLAVGNPEGPLAAMRGSKAPDWVPQAIWDLHEKSQEADEKARYYNYGPLKTNATKASNRLVRAVAAHLPGDDQAQLALMVRMNEESSRREGAGDRDLQFAPTKAGSYDPATNTITLDPINGMNAHTFVHEAIHAAISNVLANPNHPLTKDFQKFFVQIQNRLGAAYGAQDLQEFAAELVGNPDFQAVLKSIKTPRSENLFRHVLRKIAEFFGFAPKTSAFDTGLDFIDKALDITNGVEATAAEKMFLGMGNFPAIAQIGQAMPAMTRNTADQARNIYSNLSEGGGFKRMAFGLLRLDNLRDMYGDRMPSIQTLLDALEKRTGMQERRIKDANTKYKDMVKVQKAHPQAMKRLNDIAVDARIAGVDILSPKFQPEPAQQAEYSRLKTQFASLPKDVQDVYRTIRGDYDASFRQYMDILKRAADSVSPSLATRLAQEFQARKPLVGYIPFLRQGDFWVEYEDPQTGERAVSAFQSYRERQQFIDSMLKGKPHRMFQNIQDMRYAGDSLPPTHFIHQVINGLKQQGASDAQVDGVYQAYLATFPAESLMKQFMKSKNTAGMDRDIVRGYGDLMIRYARKISNSEYIPQIDRAIRQIQDEAQQAGDPTLVAAAQNITDQSAFFHNPTYSALVSAGTTLSYFEFIAGNISSALVNITSLPMMVWPMLVGRHGWANASAAMTAAGKTAMNDWSKGKYKNLYETLMDHAQLEHTMAREVLEGRRQSTDDFVNLKGRIMDGLSIPMSAAEKYNRAVTAIAAYDLAKQAGMSEEKAVQQALNTVKDIHTSGMAATGPKWMQTPLGRMFFTFKSFIWNSAYVMARAFHQAFKGENPQIRAAAQRQLLATYGMATVLTGAKGMPFYGAVSVLANMINALFGDEEEPFDFDEFMRDIFGETLFKGFANQVLNLEIANRAGIATDLIFRDDPRGVADHGYVLSALQQAFGPLGSIAVNSERAAKLFADGEIVRALETAGPSFYRNFSKGIRYLSEGATTVKGDPIMEDIGAYNSLMQIIGFSPADLSSQYERTQAAKGFEREVLQRRQNLLNKYDMAVTSGDADLLATTMDQIATFNESRPSKAITRDTLTRSQKARAAAEREMVAGVRFDKDLRSEIIEKFYDDED